MEPQPQKIYGLTDRDPEIFHVLEQGDVERLRALIQRDPACCSARMGAPEETTLLPLMAAALLGREDLCDALLGAGAPVGDANRFGQTALHLALERSHEGIARRLLEQGASACTVEAGGSTPLHIAAQRCGPEMVEALIRAGANVEAKRFNESTPAIMAAFAGLADNVRILAAHGADIVGARCYTNTGGPFDSCLTIAAERGQRALLDHLLASYAWSPEHLNVALKLAAGEGHAEIVRALVDKGADPFVPSGANNKSALYRARQKKRRSLVEYFEGLRPPRRDRGA